MSHPVWLLIGDRRVEALQVLAKARLGRASVGNVVSLYRRVPRDRLKGAI